ncbi:hypothetical protein PsAD46_01280 [Pseudovibrio sp. Ad46]|nr:hypothetical protein PsAD46_01280 [Pseudovibrio sp. Ad46]KZL01979.1 hypothetical protein PsAD5_00231 [Pseudovibrio sp. Ad5]
MKPSVSLNITHALANKVGFFQAAYFCIRRTVPRIHHAQYNYFCKEFRIESLEYVFLVTFAANNKQRLDDKCVEFFDTAKTLQD